MYRPTSMLKFAVCLVAAGMARSASADPATSEPPSDSTTGASAVARVDWRDCKTGTALMLGAGAEALAFYVYPTAGLVFVEGSLDVRLAREVDFRLTHMLGFGGGDADGAYLTILPALRVALRFNPAPYYTIWLGYEARMGVAGSLTHGVDPVGVLPLHGPDLSLAAFRFGSRGQFEIDHDGGVFLPPIWGYHFGLTVRYSFAE